MECERTLEHTLQKIDGITSAKADFNSSTTDIEYDPGKVNIEQIKTAVSGAGYRFAGERPAYGQREGSDEAIP